MSEFERLELASILAEQRAVAEREARLAAAETARGESKTNTES